MIREKVAILGAGPAGATAYNLLKARESTQVSIFGKRETTTCGIRSCAWGINRRKFEEVCRKLGLTPNRYYTNHLTYFHFGKVKLPCDVVMIDKVLFLSDLTGNEVSYEEPKLVNYNRVIDATGLTNGKGHATYQIRIEGNLPLSISISLRPVVNCLWVFPLSHTTHIGVLAFSNNLVGLEKTLEAYKPICSCHSQVHSQGLVWPLVEGNIWKVGESAGIIDPITGSGILSSITSAIFLSDNWDSPEGYCRAMTKTFGYTRSKLKALFHNEFRGLPIRPLPLWRNLGDYS